MSCNGLWFVICVPTQKHENENFSQHRELPGQDVKRNELSIPLNGSRTNSSKDLKLASGPPLEQVLRKTLDELRINDALWVLDEKATFYKVTFPCHPGLRCDLVLTTLTTNGIGMCKGSSLGILPCTVLQKDLSPSESTDDLSAINFYSEEKTLCKTSSGSSSTISKTKSDIKKVFRGFKDMQKKFLKTVTARLTVAQVVDGVRSGAEPSFDFIVFVFVASVIAALGLLENSSVMIVASMLISPIMGPILAGTFGTVIRDKSLRNLGIQTEILGLLMCVSFGFLIGLIAGILNMQYGHSSWPTSEMVSRGVCRSLWIGVLVALPSGVGVALSVLAGNAGSLVGVAISASLLPPAVNAGLLWGLAVVMNMKAGEERDDARRLINGEARWFKPSLAPNDGYETSYFIEMDKECAMLGMVSLFLALVNIVCIFIAAVLVLKIKEVAPRTSLSGTSRFWKEDIKIARNYNTTMPTTKTEDMGNQFLAEWASLNGLEPDEILSDDEEATMTRIETLKDLIQDVESDEVFQTVIQSITNKRNTRPLSQRLSTAAPPQISPPSNVPKKLSVARIFFKPIKKDMPQLSTVESISDPDLKDVPLRPPKAKPSRASRDSVAILRQSLMTTTTNPYTLWPAANQPTSNNQDGGNVFRHSVYTISEEPALRRRFSRFLRITDEETKETTI